MVFYECELNKIFMTNKEFFLQTWTDESPRFERVFDALPQDKGEYRHADDPKGKTAFELARTIAMEINSFMTFLETGKVEMTELYHGAPENIAGLPALVKEKLQATRDYAASMSEEDWDSEAVMLMGGNVGWKTTKGGMAWGMLLDLIHHRGQLSTYIRPMGGKVPSIYGPSADTGEET